MRYSVQILTIFLFTWLASAAIAQDASQPDDEPLTRGEVRQWLTVTQDDPQLSEQANRELIAEIKERGVDFALSREEEWAFGLLEATPELIAAIRNALPTEKREAILRTAAQEKLYSVFMTNYNRTDLASRRAALDAGKEFITRFASDAAVKEKRVFISRQLSNLERMVRALERTTWVKRGRN